MNYEEKVTEAEQIVACFKALANTEPDPIDPTPTTEEGMAKEIMSHYGFDLLEAIDIVKRVRVV